MKEIYVCNDGIIIVYKYSKGRKRYIVHRFHGLHNGKMNNVFIDKKISLKKKLCELKDIIL